MHRAFGVLLLVLATASNPALAQKTGTVHQVAIPAPSLAANLLGDSTQQPAAIYLPFEYGFTKAKYPVIYLLHGIGDTHEVWLKHFRVPEMLDALIGSGEIPPLIVVMPNGRNAYFGSFYANSQVTGRWGDYIANDVVRWVDSNYRTAAAPGTRAIAGHSMGGYGAITLGMRHPDIFGVIYAMSPCCLAAVDDIGHGNPSWHKAIAAADRNELFSRAREGEFYPLAMVALLAALTPNPEKKPLFVDFPVASARGELVPNEPAYTRFVDSFPVNQVDDFRANLRKLKAIRIDYGIDDQFAHIPSGARLFSEELSENRIPHELSSYAGDHRAQVEERLRTIIFPFLAEQLTAR